MEKRIVFSTVILLLLLGCSSVPLQKARSAFFSGDLETASRSLESCSDIPGKDRLLCYMEKGTVLHYAEKYEESIKILLKASRLMEKQDQFSVSEQTTAVLINDRTTDYKGEYSEQLWVHTYLMMNFLLQYDYEGALVEAKQAIELYDKYPGSLADDYYSRALIALCFENMNLPDDARIEYEKLTEAMGREGTASMPVTPGRGELVLFIGQGRIPNKIAADVVFPPSVRISIPRYSNSPSIPAVSIRCDDRNISASEMSTDLGDVARKSLNDRSAAYLARQALRAGAKEAIAQEIGEQNELGEAIARIVLFLLEEADTRSWETLPDRLTLMRVELDPGIHTLEVFSGHSIPVKLERIDIPKGKRVYRSIRF